MGKTMLLARIAAELRTEPALNARFIPLIFAEEQYAVDRLSKFWLNCLDSLADAREQAGDAQAVVEIDATVARLTAGGASSVKEDQPFADDVYSAFAKAAQTSGQRPVLLVDNLQLVFERLAERQQHSLRELLMRPGAPILVGASPSPPPQTQDYGAAFYDHFKVHYLRPLEESEMRDLLLHLAETAHRDDVRQRVLLHPARLKVLRHLTGGNPRTTLTLFFLYAEDFAPSVFGDLEGLLDRVTPLYKARFEELTTQQQVITSAIANHWDPVTASKLAQVTGLPTGTISPQLDRLEKIGTIERVDLFDESSTGYQIAERFFNIWFLMRSASRRQRREVEFLTRFLESFYEPSDRIRLAQHMMNEERFSPDRYLWSRAVADSLTEPEIAKELNRHSELLALREEASEARHRMRELIDFDALPPSTLAFDGLRKKLISLVPVESDITPEEFAKNVLGDRAMFVSGEREQLATRAGILSQDEIHSVLDTLSKSRKADVQNYTEEAVAWFSHRLASGQILSREDVADWDRAFMQTNDSNCILLMVDSLPDGFGSKLSDFSITLIRSSIQPSDTTNAWQWDQWGNRLQTRLALYDEAEKAYRKAVEIAPNNSWPWISLGNLSESRLHRFNEAEIAYREAIVRDPKNAWACYYLGNLLQDHFQRYAEAETAYREAIVRDSNGAWHWISLGNLLSNHLRRYSEAESAYREAISRDPKNAWGWNNLGNLLQNHLQRYADAEIAYREAISYDPKDVWACYYLGNLLQDHLQRYAEAEIAYREAIARDPKNVWVWNNLGNLLQNHLQRYAEAETAYRGAIACDPKLAEPWNGLGNLYCDFMERMNDSTTAFDTARRLDPSNDIILQNKLFLRRDFMGEGSVARPLMEELMAMPEHEFQDTTQLHEALFAAYDSNWGLARDALAKALTLRDGGFIARNTDDWLRTSAVLIHLSYGAELIAFLEQRGDNIRLRPWVEALRALQIGDRRALQNIAPEIRVTAEVFFDGIERRLIKLPAKTRRRS
jgi:tetratricopeptide (TPR) repeat protein/DNA-binding MarR family transcriptional regulator